MVNDVVTDIDRKFKLEMIQEGACFPVIHMAMDQLL
jgi:hypothetical protein